MPPNRIISLVPSLTELLFDLGLGKRIVGRTRFCIHPKDQIQRIPIVGGTKNPRFDMIADLKPDLIIANKEENRKEDVDELVKIAEVLVTDIDTIDQALFAIHDIGLTCGVPEKSKKLIGDINKELENIPDEPVMTAAYFIWRDPWMTVGHDTYIHSVLSHWNLENVYGGQTRYPKTTLEALSLKKPEIVLLSSEPYPFREKHIPEVSRYCTGANVVLVNGEWFSWYGSRMLHAFRQLNVFRRAIG